MGVGAGGEYLAEFEAVSVDPRTRFRRMDEALEVVKRFFVGGRVSFEGEFTSLHDVALEPAPVQVGGPPIWLGDRKEGAIRRAGRYAEVWMPYMVDPARLGAGLRQVREAAAYAGRDPRGGRVNGADPACRRAGRPAAGGPDDQRGRPPARPRTGHASTDASSSKLTHRHQHDAQFDPHLSLREPADSQRTAAELPAGSSSSEPSTSPRPYARK